MLEKNQNNTVRNYSANKDANNEVTTATEQAIAELAEGRLDAIRELYELTRVNVYGYILSILKNPQDAEDILQNTYIRVYEKAQAYVPQGKPLAWLFTIAKNLCMMKFREESRLQFLTEEEWEHCLIANDHATAEDRMVLSKAMHSLSKEEAQIIILHAVSGMKHREIAEILEMPIATVLSKYNRACKKLRKLLAG